MTVVAVFCFIFAQASASAALKFDSKVPQSVKDQLLKDLSFMQSITGQEATGLHKSIFGLTNGASYSKFFDSRVNYVGLSSCGEAIAVACVIPAMGSSRMWLTENYTKFSHPQIARMMVVYHEARHTEIRSNFWPHAKCPTPFLDSTGKTQKSIFTGAELSGKPACDKVAVGAYGSSLIMLNNISKFCTNCTSKIKADAELYSLNQMQRIVNRQALDSLSNDR